MRAPALLVAYVLGCCSAEHHVGPGCVDENGDELWAANYRPDCDVDSTDHGSSGCFDRSESVFGVTYWATPDVPEDLFQYALAVAREMFDNDEDGVVDYPALITYMLTPNDIGPNGSQKQDLAIYQCRGDIGSGALKDSFWGLTRSYGFTERTTAVQKVTLEETHHTLHTALWALHPEVFGANDEGSELLEAFDEARGDCEIANECAVSGCDDYDCTCDGSDCPDNVHAYSCSFKEGSCSGVYHYPDTGCSRTCAGSAEFYFVAWATYYGAYESLWGDACTGTCVDSQEWDLCSPSDIKASQYTQLISDLLSGQAASATTLGYVQPSRVPNGVYDASVDTDRREYDIGYVPPTPRPTSADDVASAVGDERTEQEAGEAFCQQSGFCQLECESHCMCSWDKGTCWWQEGACGANVASADVASAEHLGGVIAVATWLLIA